MREKRIDLIGKTFSKLTVQRRAENDKHGNLRWNCICECGVTRTVHGSSLKRGTTKSCGCLQKERVHTSNRERTTHGQAKRGKVSSGYLSWANMVQRCENLKYPNYSYYGGRGITICQRWSSFENFLLDMGERPEGKSLDRIDNDGPYSPDNCRWATRIEQANNRRDNNVLCIGNLSHTIPEWARIVGINPNTIRVRLKRGSTIARAIFTPVNVKEVRHAN